MKAATRKRLFTSLTIGLMFVYNVMFIPTRSFASSAPTPPPAPSAPSAPTPPPAPSAPSAPSAPTPPPAPTQNDEKDEQREEDRERRRREDREKSSDTSESSQEQSTQQPTTTPTPTPSTSNSNTNTPQNGMPGDSEIKTGDATTNANVTTNTNQNTSSTPSNSSSADTVDLSNSGNGSNSDNSNEVDLTNNTTTVQDNDADITNRVNADSNTGNNNNSANTGGNTSTTTGDSNTTATIITSANTNASGVIANEFNIIEDYVGDIVLDVNNPCQSGCQAGEVVVLGNNGNGSGSNNSNEVNQVVTDNTFQNNSADVENDIILSANTGNNTSNNNTGGDTTIETGDANVVANVVNFLNTNIAGAVIINTVNILGDLVGDIIMPAQNVAGCTINCGTGTGDVTMTNTGNGSDSTNDNSFSESTNDLVYQTNDANVNNSISIDTNTGGNQATDNTGGNTTVETGESNIDVNVLNVANQNVAGDGNWWIVLINEAGNWVGRIVGSPEGANMGGSSGTEFQINPDGTISATNSNNGTNSENTNSVSTTNNNTTVQNNTANLNNNIQVQANTGGNDASRNTGGNTEISTGDANVMVNLVNFLNTNVAGGGQIMVTVINVFGSWMGDFVGPDQQKAENNSQDPAPTPKPTEQPAIGGRVDESNTYKDQTDHTSDPEPTPLPLTNSGLTYNNSTLSYPTFNQMGTTNTSNAIAQAKVLGTSEENVTVNPVEVDLQEKEETSGKKKIKITWPAFITSILGLAYATLKAKTFFIG